MIMLPLRDYIDNITWCIISIRHGITAARAEYRCIIYYTEAKYMADTENAT